MKTAVAHVYIKKRITTEGKRKTCRLHRGSIYLPFKGSTEEDARAALAPILAVYEQACNRKFKAEFRYEGIYDGEHTFVFHVES